MLKVVRSILWLTLVGNVLLVSGQTNLLKNPNADSQAQSWRTYGEAAVETCVSNNPCFVVRNGGYFIQDVALPDDAVGQYALFIGRGASERINFDGAITGLPYLYGYMMPEVSPRGGQVLDYLQGQNMLAAPPRENEWVFMWGFFGSRKGQGRCVSSLIKRYEGVCRTMDRRRASMTWVFTSSLRKRRLVPF